MATANVPIIRININSDIVNKIIVIVDDGGSGSGSEGWVSNIKSSFPFFPKLPTLKEREKFCYEINFLRKQ